jgi:PAS domain-containing protein
VALEELKSTRTSPAEEERTASELNGLLDSLESGVLIFGGSGRIRASNDRFAQMMGLDPRAVRELGTFGRLVETLSARFAHPAEFAERCRERGFLLSFSGIVTFPRSEAIQEAVRRVDGDGYLVETDTPFLAPVPHRGRPNSPAYVVATAAAVARLRGVAPGVVAAQTTASARRLFGLPPEDVLHG